MPDLTGWLFQKSVGLRIPLSVHIDLTMRCNERCIHCYRVIERRPELTTDELRALLDDVARAGTLYLTFSGGEIFLRQRSEEHTSELQSPCNIVCRLLLEKKKKSNTMRRTR